MTQKWPNIMYVIRHGQSERNVMKDKAKAAGTAPVWSDGIRDQDTPLTPMGRLQALSVGVELNRRHPSPAIATIEGKQVVDTIFVSPYLRARQTAEEIQRSMGYWPKVVIEERIREIEFGILDGLTAEGIKIKYREEVDRRAKEGKYYYRPPGGENRPDVNLRLHSFIDTIVRDYHEKVIAVVCHSVVVLCLRHLLERWEEANYLQVDKEQDVKNASVTTYICLDNKIRLNSYNQTFYTE
jgi:broad specificity phosphatase PhoE